MRKALKFLLLLVAVPLLVLGVVLALGKQPTPLARGSESAARLAPGPYEILQFDETFIDTSRPSPAHGEFAGSSQRELLATVWHPRGYEAGPYPLIVYSHGFSSNRRGGAYLAEHLASHGYVVVAANFPLTNTYAPDRPWVRDIVNQPGDVSFLIDQLVARSTDVDSGLWRMIDERQIGVTGISLGGMTSTLVAFHPELGDERVGAALSIAGPTRQFLPAFFEHREVPFLMLAADIDALVPFGSNAAPVLEMVPESQLVTVVNGSHTGFSGQATPLRFMSNPDALGCYIVLQNIENDNDDFWLDALGTPEQGINYDAANELCLMDPLPPAMNPMRQQMITALVVRAFFDSQFATHDDDREAAQDFLADTLPGELGEVRYQAAD